MAKKKEQNQNQEQEQKEKRKPGRPYGTLKYDNIEDLQAGIDKYFADCEAKPVLDDEGNQITDRHGNPMFFPPKEQTLEGLALSLGISEDTLTRYGKPGYAGELSEDYCGAIAYACARVRAHWAGRLGDRDGVQGAKFYATNNFERTGGLKYAERQEVSMDVAPITFIDNLE